MRGRIIYVPRETATTPRNGECITDRWWCVHPDHGLAFYTPYTQRSLPMDESVSPQCNGSKSLTERIQHKLYPECQVEHFPVVYLEHANRLARMRLPPPEAAPKETK